MTNPSCPECKGTGEYRGLNTVEPCRLCHALPRKNGKSLPLSIQDVLCATEQIPRDKQINLWTTPETECCVDVETCESLGPNGMIQVYPTGIRNISINSVRHEMTSEMLFDTLGKRVLLVITADDKSTHSVTGVLQFVTCWDDNIADITLIQDSSHD
jgi:hypothetical protein